MLYERVLNCCEKRQSLDTLRSPLRADFAARYSPDLFSVSLEEDIVEAFAESVGNPLLEGLFVLFWKHQCFKIAHENQKAVPDA